MIRREDALVALRGELDRQPFDGVTVLELADAGPVGFLLRLRARQRLHPHTLVIAADDGSLARDHATGDALFPDDAQTWAAGVLLHLMVELDTGVLRWGRRVTLEDGTVAIDPSLPALPSPRRWYVSRVPLERDVEERAFRPSWWTRLRAAGRGFVVLGGDDGPSEPDPAPGEHLREAGFDVEAGRTANAAGELVTWLQLHRDHRFAAWRPVGQLVVTWRDEPNGVAELTQLACSSRLPRGGVEQLVLTGIHDAADAGARSVEHRLDAVHQLDLALPWQVADGVARLDAADVP